MTSRQLWLISLAGIILAAGTTFGDTNILTNPGFESGTSGWLARSGTISAVTSPVRTGTYSGRSTGRTATWQGIQQDVLGKMVAGQAYQISAYVRISAASDTVKVSIQKTDGNGTTYANVATGTANNTGWIQLSGNYTLSVTGTLTELLVYFEGPASGVDIYVDDAVVYGPDGSQVDPEASGQVSIGTRHQTIEGFGAAGAWYEGTLVSLGQSNPGIYDILFRDLGLDIYRLRNAYDQDGGADYMSRSAQIIAAGEASLGRPLKVLISCWSPPAYLKSNGETANGGTLIGGPSAYAYSGLADWWADSVTAWAGYGVDADYISIQNEPDWSASWDTCLYEGTETTSYAGYNLAFEAVWQELNTRMGSSMPKMLGGESAGLLGSPEYLDALLNLSHVYGYAHHLYNIGAGDNPDQYLTTMQSFNAAYGDKPLFQTEYEKATGSWPDAYNMALLLHNSLTVEEVAGYLYWDLFWGSTNVGLVSVTSSSYTINSDYWGFKQFSAYIHSGWQRVDASTDSSALRISAYISPNGENLTVVVINTSDSTDISLTPSFPGFTILNGTIYRTSQTQNCVNAGSYTGGAVTIAAKSVVTLALTGPTTAERTLTVSSTAGGSVTTPGEGDFQYTQGSTAVIAATEDLHYDFTEWTGSAVTAGKVADPYGASTTVTMDADYTVVANFSPDLTPPAAPTGLTAAGGNQSVLLNWNDNGEADLYGYNVYRSTTSGSGYTQINGSLLSSSNYTDTDVINGTTYYYVVTAVDEVLNESADSGEASATPNQIILYTFAGITQADTDYNAYACDVDVFPFAGSSDNRNTMVEATDAQYINISANNTAEWVTADPGYSDQVFLWVEMKIHELPASISRIDLTFNGNTDTSSTVHRLYVLSAGADWTQDVSWIQVGSDLSIPPDVDTTLTGSITADIEDYIDAAGTLIWGVYELTSSEDMRINYLEMTVYANNVVDTTPPAAPAGLTTAAGEGVVDLDWDDNIEEDLAGYNLYRSTTSGSGYTPLNGALLTGSNYTDDSVINGTTYYYVVTAVDTSSNESDPCPEEPATPADVTPPAAPAGLWSSIAGGPIVLDWNDNEETDLDGYNVYRSSTSGSGYTQLNGTLLTSSNYTDSGAVSGNVYYYVVTAVDTADNESADSFEISALLSDNGMGLILREWWTGISGGAVGDLTSHADYPDSPSGRDRLGALEGPTNWDDTYGTRIRGYLHPPAGGDYTFWIASDDDSQLRLSIDGDPNHAVPIAFVSGFTDPRQWDAYPSQQSSSFSLTAGQKYYIEVLHKEGSGGDHVSVAWSGPGISQQVISGAYLSPWFVGLYGDFTGEGLVDLEDLAAFVLDWLDEGCSLTAGMDLNGDCRIDLYEFSILSQNWLFE